MASSGGGGAGGHGELGVNWPSCASDTFPVQCDEHESNCLLHSLPAHEGDEVLSGQRVKCHHVLPQRLKTGGLLASKCLQSVPVLHGRETHWRHRVDTVSTPTARCISGKSIVFLMRKYMYFKVTASLQELG